MRGEWRGADTPPLAPAPAAVEEVVWRVTAVGVVCEWDWVWVCGFVWAAALALALALAFAFAAFVMACE